VAGQDEAAEELAVLVDGLIFDGLMTLASLRFA
jgi:hypothetical protein